MARDRQRSRTRQDLLEAALRLSTGANKPTLEEVAEEALVSRATAYRYFSNADELLLEASVHMAFPEPRQVFEGQSSDPVARLKRADVSVDAMIRANEASLRLMLANAIQQAGNRNGLPSRQNRRLPLIEEALAPAVGEFDGASLDRLKSALALVIGTEAMIVFKDVLQLSDDEARDVKHWVIEALVEKSRLAKRNPRSIDHEHSGTSGAGT